MASQWRVEQRQVELELAGEVLVQHRLGDAGPLGDVVHRRGVVALRDEDLLGRGEQLLAASGTGQAGGTAVRLGTTGTSDHVFLRQVGPANSSPCANWRALATYRHSPHTVASARATEECTVDETGQPGDAGPGRRERQESGWSAADATWSNAGAALEPDAEEPAAAPAVVAPLGIGRQWSVGRAPVALRRPARSRGRAGPRQRDDARAGQRPALSLRGRPRRRRARAREQGQGTTGVRRSARLPGPGRGRRAGAGSTTARQRCAPAPRGRVRRLAGLGAAGARGTAVVEHLGAVLGAFRPGQRAQQRPAPDRAQRAAAGRGRRRSAGREHGADRPLHAAVGGRPAGSVARADERRRPGAALRCRAARFRRSARGGHTAPVRRPVRLVDIPRLGDAAGIGRAARFRRPAHLGRFRGAARAGRPAGVPGARSARVRRSARGRSAGGRRATGLSRSAGAARFR